VDNGLPVSSKLFRPESINGQPSTEPVYVAVAPSNSSCSTRSFVTVGPAELSSKVTRDARSPRRNHLVAMFELPREHRHCMEVLFRRADRLLEYCDSSFGNRLCAGCDWSSYGGSGCIRQMTHRRIRWCGCVSRTDLAAAVEEAAASMNPWQSCRPWRTPPIR